MHVRPPFALIALISLLSFTAAAVAQTAAVAKPAPPAATAPTAVPTLIPWSGIAEAPEGKAIAGEKPVTFLIFKDSQGGEPLWVETQTVAIDANGHYQVQLGASSPAGIPTTTFASGEGRWLEIQIPGQQTQPRVLLTSVPYAMKAAEAETLGGLSAQSFVTQSQLAEISRNLAAKASPQITPFVSPTGSGTTNVLPIWTSSSALGNSFISQSGASVVVGTSTTPAPLSVYGNISTSASGTYAIITSSSYNNTNFAGSEIALNRYEGTAAAPAAVQLNDSLGWFQFFGYDGSALQRSGELAVYADATPTAGIVPGRFQINTSNSAGVNTGRLIAYSNDNVVMSQHGGKVGIGTNSQPAATLEVNGTAKFDGLIAFSAGQTFPGTGTITGVTAGTGMTGGGTTGAVTLNVDTTQVPLLGSANVFTQGAAFGGETAISGSSTDWMLVVTNNGAGKGTILGQASGNSLGIEGASPGGSGLKGVSDTGFGVFAVSNTSGTALAATSNGSGPAATFTALNSTMPAVSVYSAANAGLSATATTGYAGNFANNATFNATVYATNSGNGNAGTFNNNSASRVALAGVNASTDTNAIGTYGSVANGDAVYGVSSGGNGVYGTTTSGVGVYGIGSPGVGVSGTSTTSAGVAGYSTSGSGVYASSTSGHGLVAVSQSGTALDGTSASGIAIIGQRNQISAMGGTFLTSESSTSIFGDAGPGTTNFIGVVGAADDSTASYFLNNSSSSSTVSAFNLADNGFGPTGLFRVFQAGSPKGTCGFGGAGDLTCTGQVKSVVTTASARQVETYSVQSSENWLEDFGSGELVDGKALIELDPAFADAANTEVPYHVFLTPEGEAQPLYITRKSAGSFEVHEAGNGSHSISFSFRVVARRRGTETQRLVDVTERIKTEIESARPKRRNQQPGEASAF